MRSLLRFIVQQPRWLLLLVVFGFALSMALILLGSKGNEIAGPLSLLVAIVALGIAIRFRPGAEPEQLEKPPRRRTVLAGAALVVIAGSALGAFYTAVIYKVPLPVTDQVDVTDKPDSAGQQWTAVVRGQSEGRTKLSATLRLVNQDRTGNCVAPTRLRVSAVQNGAVANPSDAAFRDGDEVSVEVGDVVRPGLLVLAVNETPGCRLALRLDDVLLHNDFPW